jgi:predicted nucleotidyltransferase
MIDREQITAKLREKLEPLNYVYAFWLEGSDANNTVDEYSDIDFWVDFEDESEQQCYEAVENALSEISAIDYKYISDINHPKLRQRIYHLSGSSEYLMIDFCWQLHSRPRNENIYISGSRIEAAKVVFDKDNIIRYKDYNADEFKEQNLARLNECKYRYSQHMRPLKYALRGQYLEAYAYYNRYVLEPLIDLLRIIYTPANSDYYLIHISQHIPKEHVKKLEYFAQLNSTDDIAAKIPQAEEWFNELLEKIE